MATTLDDKMEKGGGLEKRNTREMDAELDQRRRNYEKRLTVLVEIEEDRITMMEILKKVRRGVWSGNRLYIQNTKRIRADNGRGKRKEEVVGRAKDKEQLGYGERGGLYGDGGLISWSTNVYSGRGDTEKAVGMGS